ncbi:MAG TPA: hypothetical protein VGB74_12165 [Actinoplanes sp.]
MSYPVQPPPVAMAPPSPPAGRPPGVTAASILLWVMATGGLIYAITTLAIVPGVVSRFRDASDGAFRSFEDVDTETYVAVVWLGAAIALAVGVILLALYVVLGLALRRGSNAARIATLVVSGLGVLAGAGTLVIMAVQRNGETLRGSLADQLTSAYPSGWIGSNVALAGAQMVGYALVGLLVLTSPAIFFGRRGSAAAQPAGAPTPPYGMPYPTAQGYAAQGQPAAAGYPPPGYAAGPGYTQPGYTQPGYAPPGYTQPGYAPPGYTQPDYAQPDTAGYARPSAPPANQPAAAPNDEYWSRPSE